MSAEGRESLRSRSEWKTRGIYIYIYRERREERTKGSEGWESMGGVVN